MNTNTAYRSPIAFLSLTAEESTNFSQTLLQAAKNKICSTDVTLENEVDAILQHVSPATWPFHRAIYEQKGLLQFLEEGVFAEEQMRNASFLRYNPAFVQFVSLPFASSFCLAATDALKKEDDFAGINRLMDYASFVLAEHDPIAFAPINAWLQALHLKLKPLSWEQFVQDESILNFLFSSQWIIFFNSLPAACHEALEDLTGTILQLLKRFRLDASEIYLKAMCEKLCQLKMTPDHQQDLKEYKKKLYATKGTISTSGKNQNARFFLLFWRRPFVRRSLAVYPFTSKEQTTATGRRQIHECSRNCFRFGPAKQQHQRTQCESFFLPGQPAGKHRNQRTKANR